MTVKNVNPKIKHNLAAGQNKASHSKYTPPATKPLGAKMEQFGKHLPWVLVAILFLALSLIYFPVAYQGKAPQASDITQWEGAAKAIIDYNATHKDNALWTPRMFSGMPSYMISFPNRYPFLESLTKLTDKVINWRIFLLFIGGLGIFLLLRQMKLSPWIAFFGAVAFVFSCHWVGLIEIGHNTKFRAIMYIPWVVWALFRLRERPNLLNLGLLATFFITQLRENHPQITYYLYIFIGMFWLYQLLESIKKKDHKQFWLWTILIAAALGLTALAVMNPYLSTMEYSHYTMRGGAEGLEKSYAQGWSFPPVELAALIIPDFFGGINQSYWGYMTFTQIYNYFGIVVLAFGVLALCGKNRRTAWFLWISSFVFLLMSFGSFTPAISDLFFKYLPMFNKFRVPSMILIMVQFNAVLLAALGIDGLIDKAGDAKWQKRLFNAFLVCGALFLIYLVAAKGIFKGLPFTNAQEIQNYEAQQASSQLDGIKAMRLDLLYKSGILSMLFLTVGIGLAYLFSARRMKPALFILLITFLSFIDLFIYTGKHLKDLYPASERTARFEMQDYDQFLLEDQENYRIYPFNMNRVRPAGEWAYYHQSIDGYSAAKLKRYDDVLKLVQGDAKTDGEMVRYLKGLFEQNGREIPTPVLNMLNARYFVLPDSLPNAQFLSQMRPVFGSYSGSHVFRNNGVLPRAWFVDSLEVIAKPEERLARMKNPQFNPAKLALVESEIPGTSAPDSAMVRQTANEMQRLEYEIYTDKDAFLVLSEIYYPAGWTAYIDGKATDIHPVNHVLRGVKIPAGQHKLEMKFASATYTKSITLSLLGLLLTLVAVVGGFFLNRSKAKEEIVPSQA